MPIYNVSNYLNNSDDLLEEYSLLMNDNQYEINNCMEDLLETGQSILESDDEFLTESLIDDYKDLIKNTITIMTKGQDAALKQSTEAAEQASNYRKEIERIAKNSNNIKQKAFLLNEYKVEKIYTGNGTVTTKYYKDVTFSGIAIDFKKISNLLKSGKMSSVNSLMKTYKDRVNELAGWRPIIVKSATKQTIGSAGKFLSELIDYNKKASQMFNEYINEMKAALDSAYDIMNNLEQKDAIKYMNKFIHLQKKIYNHDVGIMNMNNLMVLRQSRELKKLIDKYSK